MCLYIKRKEPRIAKFDIPVYKILKEDWCHLQTPFICAPVNLKRPLIAYDTSIIYHTSIIYYTSIIKNDYWNNTLCINAGVIHCFWNKYHAQKYLEDIKKMFTFQSSTLIIQKAYIPKGTQFFIGRGKSFGEIGAERIIFKL